MNALTPTVTVDLTDVQKMFARVSGSLELPYDRVITDIGQRAGRSVELNFRRGGRPEPFDPLTERTIRARMAQARRTGKQPVAGYRTPLRVSDALRKAAIATKSGQAGSDVKQTGWSWSNTLTLPYAARQNKYRPFFLLQTADEETFRNLLWAEVKTRINRATR